MKLSRFASLNSLVLIAGILAWQSPGRAQEVCFLIDSSGRRINLERMCQDSDSTQTESTDQPQVGAPGEGSTPGRTTDGSTGNRTFEIRGGSVSPEGEGTTGEDSAAGEPIDLPNFPGNTDATDEATDDSTPTEDDDTNVTPDTPTGTSSDSPRNGDADATTTDTEPETGAEIDQSDPATIEVPTVEPPTPPTIERPATPRIEQRPVPTDNADEADGATDTDEGEL